MMVDRCHSEDALAPQLEGANLQDHRKRFDDEDAANEKQEYLLLDDDGDGAKGPAERERAHIAHEYFRGVRVVPKEAERRADQRPAKNGKFSDPRDVLNLEIGGPARVAADVGQHGKRARGDNRATDCQAVKAIGQIHRIGGTNDDHANKGEEWEEGQGPDMFRFHKGMDDQVGVQTLEEGDHQLRRVGEVCNENEQGDPYDQAYQHLKVNLVFRREPQVSLLRDFRVVVNEPDSGEADQGKEREQNKRISQVSPKQRGHGRRQDDQHAPHGGCAGLFLVLLGSLVADVLPDLQIAQALNQPGAEHEAEKHGRQARIDGSNGDVAKDV